MLQTVKLVSFTSCLSIFAGILIAGEWDQGPVILGMDRCPGEGSVALFAGPFSGSTVAESEPNDLWSEADPVGSADDYTGNIASGYESDFVSFYAETGKWMVLETINGGGTLWDTTLTLYDTNGRSLLEYNDDGGAGNQARIEFVFPVSGTYFLEVNSDSTYTGTYQLSVRPIVTRQPIGGWVYIWKALDAMAPRVYRPNDGSVAVLGSSESTMTSGDAGAAYYHVVATAAEDNPVLSGVVEFYAGPASISTFFAELTLGNVNPAIIALPGSGLPNSLDAAEGLVLADNAAGISDFIGTGGGLIAHGDVSGGSVAYTWLPRVFSGAGTGYVRTIPTISDEGRFTLPELVPSDIGSVTTGFFTGHNMSVFVSAEGVPVPGPGTGMTFNEREPNDLSTQADVMAVGDDYTGDIQNGGEDQDRVAFTVFAGQKIVAETVQLGLSDTTLTLYDRNGTTQLGFDDDGAFYSRMSRLEYTFATAGTYYLAVDSFSTGMGTFLMRLRELLPPQDVDLMIGTIPGPWLWLGKALSVSSEIPPYLSGTGELVAGTPFSLNLTRAKASAPAFLFLGFWQWDLPFKGGLMVPNPFTIVPLVTDTHGAGEIPGTLSPRVPADITIFAQFWIQDSKGPEGFTASNGLSLTTQ